MSLSKTLLVSLSLASLIAFSSAGAAEKFGSDRHVARGVQCQTCHGPDLKNIEYPDENTCIKCHPKATVAKKTEKLSPNPHAAPHNGHCTLCHMMHEPTVNYCNQCHKYDYPKIP